jgi:hypothetical protein
MQSYTPIRAVLHNAGATPGTACAGSQCHLVLMAVASSSMQSFDTTATALTAKRQTTSRETPMRLCILPRTAQKQNSCLILGDQQETASGMHGIIVAPRSSATPLTPRARLSTMRKYVAMQDYMLHLRGARTTPFLCSACTWSMWLACTFRSNVVFESSGQLMHPEVGRVQATRM